VTLVANVGVRLGRLDLRVALDAADGETVAVLGPNGAGKTTLLRALAGLVPLHDGVVRIDNAVMDQPSSATYVVPERRSVGVVFQDYLLFPHLTVLENVAFGLRSRGTPRAEARRRAHEWLARVGLDEHARSKPGALSGGQQQRDATCARTSPRSAALAFSSPTSCSTRWRWPTDSWCSSTGAPHSRAPCTMSLSVRDRGMSPISSA
jgi:molybdate transport system ATP-binding protein